MSLLRQISYYSSRRRLCGMNRVSASVSALEYWGVRHEQAAMRRIEMGVLEGIL